MCYNSYAWIRSHTQEELLTAIVAFSVEIRCRYKAHKLLTETDCALVNCGLILFDARFENSQKRQYHNIVDTPKSDLFTSILWELLYGLSQLDRRLCFKFNLEPFDTEYRNHKIWPITQKFAHAV